MTPEKRAASYFAMMIAGGVAIVAKVAALALDLPDFWKGVPLGLMIVSLATILLRALRDDYTQSRWHAGTGWAFAATGASLFLAPFIEGVRNGLTGLDDGADFPVQAVGFLAIAAFYACFHVRWWRTAR